MRWRLEDSSCSRRGVSSLSTGVKRWHLDATLSSGKHLIMGWGEGETERESKECAEEISREISPEFIQKCPVELTTAFRASDLELCFGR